MANNYLAFSEIIDKLTDDEIKWWSRELKEIQQTEDSEYELCHDAEIDIQERLIWFHADEFGDIESVAEIVKKFLKAMRPNEYFMLTWACWCSKPRIGEFDGGAIFVTASEIKYHYVSEWFNPKKWLSPFTNYKLANGV